VLTVIDADTVMAPRRPTPREQPLADAFLLAVAAGVVYLLVGGNFRFDFGQTAAPHHVFMADAMLHGQLHIRPEALAWKAHQVRPRIAAELDAQLERENRVLTAAQREMLVEHAARKAVLHDWAVVGERRYGYWGPLVPLLTLPFVALFGLGVSDAVINALFGALNVGLFYWLLWWVHRAALLRMSRACRVGLTLVLAFGTSHWWLTCAGQIWFAIQVMTLPALLGALICACAPRPRASHYALAGALFGAAILGRSIVALMGLFFAILIWGRARPWDGGRQLRRFAGRCLAFGVPLLAALGVQLMYNAARFGDPLESGLDIQIRTGGNTRFLETYEQYGPFSLHYLPKNFRHYFLSLDFPRLAGGLRWFDEEGNSVFLMTPPLLFVFLCWRRWSWFTLSLLAGAAPLVWMLLIFNGTGWVQFGPRYLLDATPLLLLLAGAGMTGRIGNVSYGLIVAALLVQLFGVSRVCQVAFGAWQGWITEWTLLGPLAIAVLARVAWMWRRGADGQPDPATA
jgi:hypothetical protein